MSDSEEGGMLFQRTNSRLGLRGPTFYDTETYFDHVDGEPEQRDDVTDHVDRRDIDAYEELIEVEGAAENIPTTDIPLVLTPVAPAPPGDLPASGAGKYGALGNVLPAGDLRKKSIGVPPRGGNGLSMKDILSGTSHLWVMHQRFGGPVRVRMFQSALQFGEYVSNTDIQLPKSVTSREAAKAGTPHSPLRRRSKHISQNDDAHSTHSKSTTTTTRSSRISSSTSKSSKAIDDRITDAHWVDLQTRDREEMRELLQLFRVSESTVDNVLQTETEDKVEHYPSLGYVFVNLCCLGISEHGGLCTRRRFDNISANSSIASTAPSILDDATRHVVVSCIVFVDWIITIHTEPFEELADLVKKIRIDFTLKKKMMKPRHHVNTVLSPDNIPDLAETVIFKRMMRPAWVLSTLTDFVVANFLPDPTPLLQQVDKLDGDVIMIANTRGPEGQRAIIKQIAHLRRLIAHHRRLVSQKERLLTQLLTPAMRATFVSKRSSDADLYSYCQQQIASVAGRIDSARDILQTANGNFVAAGTLRMNRSSQSMEMRMHLMSQVTVMVAPLLIIEALFSMNINIPFMTSSGFETLTAFWVLLSVIGVWLLFSVPSFVEFLRAKDPEADLIPWGEELN